MKCPHCDGKKTVVTNSRASDDHRVRYRKCSSCDNRWVTVEVPLAWVRDIECRIGRADELEAVPS